MEISLRSASNDDAAFVDSVFFETQRWIIEALFSWRGDHIEWERFHESYDVGNIQLIVLDDERVGWLTVHRFVDHFDLDFIYLTGKWQRLGIGTALIQALISESGTAGVPLRLSTAKINPAETLYERLGFVATRTDRYKVYMEHADSAPNRA